MPKIFISYRRDDSQYQADRLHAALKKHVANPKRNIFIDVDNIPVGVDFVEHLDRQVAQCDVLLAIIGPTWVNAGASLLGGRRLDDPKDFVRIEIASALSRGIPVAPVLLDGTPMPREDQLPPDLKSLARRNAVEVRRATFDTDIERMIRGLKLAGNEQKSTVKATAGRERSSGSSWLAPVIALCVFGVAGGGAWAWFANPGGWHGVQPINPTTPGASPGLPPDTAIADPGQKGMLPPSPEKGGLNTGQSGPNPSQLPGGVADPSQLPTLPMPAKTPAASQSVAPPADKPKMLDVTMENTLTGHWDRVRSVVFSPDGARILTASYDNTARVWDARSGTPILQLDGDGKNIISAAFSPDGARILTTSEDKTARLWDATSGKPLMTFTGHEREVFSGAFSTDGARIVTASLDKTARVWDAATGKQLTVVSEEKDSIYCAAFSRDGARIVTASIRARIWDAVTGKLVMSLPQSAECAAYSKDGKRILTASMAPRLWDATSGVAVETLPNQPVNGVSAALSNDGKYVVIASSQTNIWDVSERRVVGTITQNNVVTAVAFSPDGRRVALASDNGAVRIWRIEK